MNTLIPNWFPRIILALMALGLSGCFEVESEIEIRKDGSGRIESTMLLSDRMLVSMMSAENDSSVTVSDGMPFDEASLKEMMGDEAEVLNLNVEELPDGGRKISYSAEIPDMIGFLNTEDEKPGIGVRIVQLEAGQAALEFSGGMESKGDMKLELEQMYGLMKGLFVQTKVSLPVALSSDSGSLSSDHRSISWAFDLRDRKGLAQAKAEEERLNGKVARASFSLANLEWDLTKLASPDVSMGKAQGVNITELEGGSKGLQAEVALITSSRNRTLVSDDVLEKPRYFSKAADELELHILLHWDTDSKPTNYSTPVLEEIITDTGENLMLDKKPHSFSSDVKEKDEAVIKETTAKLPSKEAKSIRSLKGYVSVIAGVETEVVQITNPVTKLGAENVDSVAMKQVGGVIKSVEGTEITIECQGKAFDSAVLVKPDGSRQDGNRGWSGFNNKYTYTYNFDDPIGADDVLELTVRLSETSVRVPFSAQNVELP